MDVDQYDPDKFVEETVPEESGGQGPSESEVNTFLAQYPFAVTRCSSPLWFSIRIIMYECRGGASFEDNVREIHQSTDELYQLE